MMIAHDELITEVRHRMGGGRDDEVERAIEATFTALSETMRWVDLKNVASALPDRFRDVLLSRPIDAHHDKSSFYARVASLEGVQFGYAVEHAQAVCRALAVLLDEPRRAHFNIDVWPELTRPTLEDTPASSKPVGHTIADGRPGSRHPLSEAKAPERTQHHSVEEENPHASRKLSSGS